MADPKKQTKFVLNGKSFTSKQPSDTPLLWVIRDEAKHKGTKFGCGKGLCGACTLHMNGASVRSCQTPLSAAAGAKITTIEGLADDGKHPLQVAWTKSNVPQCGYCQPGQIMSAASLIASNKTPKDSDIDEAMSGNLCRCGTYPRIREAIKMAAKETR